MKRYLILIIALLSPAVVFAENYDPKAAAEAVATEGNARFTVLTDRLIRMEWCEDGLFEDRASLAIVNRNLPVPSFRVLRNGEELTIKTSSVTLMYKGSEPFSEDNLKVTFKLNGRVQVWYPGKDDSANLLGTSRTLDKCKGFNQLSAGDPMEPGILSRDGWALVDESSRHLFDKDNSSWGEWVTTRPDGRRYDWYLFAYGHDYEEALLDFTRIAGRIPMPPKYAFGYWWSRYWKYSDEEFLALGKEFRDRKIPIDVMVIDMDWHYTYPLTREKTPKDEVGQRFGWTGYTWNRDYFADPEGFLADVHDLGLKTSLNLHPALGIGEREECYDRFVSDYISRTSEYDGPQSYRNGAHRVRVPFRMSQQEWADAYFNSVIHPLEDQGVDFWWLDWQQWKESEYVSGLNNTFWLNWTFFNDKVRQGTSEGKNADRPMIYHRWGGLGSHRYQLGFSGDTYDTWEVLAFLPYFTATASNVGYGYWGHDIGGHMQLVKRPTEAEMMTRWIQYGVFTPIFKTHSNNSSRMERRIWAFPDHYQYMKDAIELRYALSPYIYDMARKAYDTGVSLCRPLYYTHPKADEAYEWKEEFMFGDNILATVLCQPLDTLTGKTERKIWFPTGSDWYDMAQKKIHKGGSVKTLYYGINENPWYIKSGAMIPMAAEDIQSLQGQTSELRLFVAPGTGNSVYRHYEDDGISQSYEEDYAITEFKKQSNSAFCVLEIGQRVGRYVGMPQERNYIIVLGGLDREPRSVRLNDGSLIKSHYNPIEREATFALPPMSSEARCKVTVKY